MAEFCSDCLRGVMGLNPDDYPEWLVEKGAICEECGLEYNE